MSEGLGLGRDFGIVLAGQIMAFAQGLLLLPLIIRTAGETVFGAYVLLLSITGLFFGMLGYGIPYRYQRNVVSAVDRTQRRELFEPQFTFHVVAVTVISIIIVLLGHPLTRWISEGTTQFTPLYIVGLIVSKLLYKQTVDYFQYTRRFLYFSLSLTSGPYLFVAMLLIMAATGRRLTLDVLLLLQVVASLLACAPLLVKLVREIGAPRFRLPLRQFIEDARIGLPLTVELAIDFLLRSSDRYLISLFLSVGDVGRYQPAYAVGSIALFFITMMETILVPAFSRLIDIGDRATAMASMEVVARLFLMVAVPMVIGSLMVGPSLVSLLTTPDIGAAGRWVTPFVAASMVFYGIARLASAAAFLIGRTSAILRANAFGAGVNIFLNLLFMPLMRDITVPAATAVIGYIANYVCIAWALRALWPLHIEWHAMLRYFLAASGMGAILWCLGFRAGEVTSISALSLAGCIAAGISSYFVLLHFIGGFGAREWTQLIGLARRRIPDTGQVA
jgi:O-antigen/teichoic acid export membrane protein